MFEVGKVYRITMMDGPDGPTEFPHCEVKAVKFPLIKVTGMTMGPDRKTRITILNTGSSAFISALPVKWGRREKAAAAAAEKYFTPEPPKAQKRKKSPAAT